MNLKTNALLQRPYEFLVTLNEFVFSLPRDHILSNVIVFIFPIFTSLVKEKLLGMRTARVASFASDQRKREIKSL